MLFLKDFHIKGTCISFTNYKFPSTLCLILLSLQYNPLSPTTTNLLYLPIKHSKTCLGKQPNCQVKRLVVSQSNPKSKQITNQYIVLLSLGINRFYSRKNLTVRYISAKDILHCGEEARVLRLITKLDHKTSMERLVGDSDGGIVV